MPKDLISVMGASIVDGQALQKKHDLTRYGYTPPAASKEKPWSGNGVYTQNLIGVVLGVGAVELGMRLPRLDRAPTDSPSRRTDPRVPPEEPGSTLYKTTAVAAAAGVGLALLLSRLSR